MYAYISGTVVHKGSNFVIVDNNGIGYRISTSVATLNRIGNVNDETKIYTHYHVREDNISLFGFATNEELNMFELLITVSGVGPKVALSVLSAISPSSFALAVITKDAKTLTKAQGVGNKLAQKIIFELKDKLEKFQKEQTGSLDISHFEDESMPNDKIGEASSALMVLGFNQYEANKAVRAVYTEEMDVETLIMEALKSLHK